MTTAAPPSSGTDQPPRRYEQLDSLRGLAALTVMNSHFMNVFPIMDQELLPRSMWLIAYTPLHIVMAASQAVLLFYVLSGFVLTLPFLKGKVQSVPFLIKRICRIYPPYLVALGVALLARALIYHGPPGDTSRWVEYAWFLPPRLPLVLGHVLLLGDFNSHAFIPVTWSLIHEVRLSLLFPLLVIAITTWDWRVSIGASWLVALVGMVLDYLAEHRFGWQQNYTLTLCFVPMFVTGGVLARYREEAVAWYTRQPRWWRRGLVVLAVLGYTSRYWLWPWSSYHKMITDYPPITLSVVIFIVAILSNNRLSTCLTSRPMIGLGRISYSLYLYHSVALLACVFGLHGRVPMPLILLSALLCCLVVSVASYRYIEVPSIVLGRYLAQRAARSQGGP